MNRSRSAFLFLQIGIFMLGVSGSIYAALTPANSMMNWYSNDDAFYYYKVAQNVLAGRGFSFDGINLSNGFHPLWMVVCLGVFWLSSFNLLLPLRVLIIVSGVLNGLTGIILLRLLKRHLPVQAASLGALVWILLPSIHLNYTAHGLESALSAFFVALLLNLSTDLVANSERKSARKLLLLGLVAALTILSRLDTLFVVAMIGFFVIFRITRMKRVLIFDLVAILLGSIFAWIIRFGTAPMILNNYSIYPQLVTAMVVTPLVLFFVGIYSQPLKGNLGRFLLRIFIAAVVTTILLYLVMNSMQTIGMNLLVSRSLLLLDGVLTFGMIVLIRLFFYKPYHNQIPTPWQEFKHWVSNELKLNIRDGILFSIPIIIMVGGYMLANRIMFLTFSPVSGQVKTWWGTLDNTVYRVNETLVDLLGLGAGSGRNPWSLLSTIIADVSIFLRNLFTEESMELPERLFLVLFFLVFILLVYLLSRKDGYMARRSFAILIPAMAFGCFLHISYYAARAYGHTRSWYWVPETMLLVLLGAVLSSRLFEKIRQWTRSPYPATLLLLIAAGYLLFLHSRYIINLCPPTVTPEHQSDYLAETRELEFYTDENAYIGMTGGGVTAYFIQYRTVVNLDGLINSLEYFNALRSGAVPKFLNDMGLDYVFGNPYMLLETDPYQQIFSGRIAKIGVIRGVSNFTLYRYEGAP